ncbi:MAG: hypothetical protein QF437_07520 [Planctomycetota bacterium]|jgi:hypothetical protein|nr:hypothetical protein [Planctomycetota bacterium]MDP7130320.1 hypothetical protein [Planctomycetota bacterium]MDP7251319.1 hypothetical protein [Planctomycetota bacterium]
MRYEQIRWLNFPLNEPIGFNGKLIYAPFLSQENVLERYREWID